MKKDSHSLYVLVFWHPNQGLEWAYNMWMISVEFEIQYNIFEQVDRWVG